MPAAPPATQAFQAARDYLAFSTSALTTLSTGPFAGLVLPSCACRGSLLAEVASWSSHGWHLRGGGYSGVRVSSFVSGGAGRATVAVAFGVDAGDVVDAAGAVVSHRAGSTGGQDVVALAVVDGRWKVADVHVVATGVAG